jgi:HSP20 family protein
MGKKDVKDVEVTGGDATGEERSGEVEAVRPGPWWMAPDWFGRMWPDLFSQRVPELLGSGGDAMRVEEFREDGSLVVRVEIPDVDPEKDIEVTVDRDRLSIRAERTQRTDDRDKHGYRSEFRYGSFHRILQLPAGTSEQDIQATYRDGILEVRLPIDQERASSAKIPIQR